MSRGAWSEESDFKKYQRAGTRRNRVCVLEDLDFYWDEKELKTIKRMWLQELSVYYMALILDRDPDEILLAVIHLAREERIEKRKSGILEGIIGCFDIKGKIYKERKKNGEENRNDSEKFITLHL